MVLGLLTCSMTLLWLFSIFCFGRSMISLGASVTWAVHHSRAIADRDKRLRRRSVGEPVEENDEEEFEIDPIDFNRPDSGSF